MNFVLLALGAPELLEGLELVQLSFLSRHSIKVPKHFNYSQYSAYPINQSYGAPPGELTPRGVELAEALGRYYGAWYEQLTSHRCPTQQRCPQPLMHWCVVIDVITGCWRTPIQYSGQSRPPNPSCTASVASAPTNLSGLLIYSRKFTVCSPKVC